MSGNPPQTLTAPQRLQPVPAVWHHYVAPPGTPVPAGAMAVAAHHPGAVVVEAAKKPRPRKPYTATKVREMWTPEEHGRMLEGLKKYKRDWAKVTAYVGTRSAAQVRSHAQKYFDRVQRDKTDDYVPEARPKRKSTSPYPRKIRPEATPVAQVVSQPMPPHYYTFPHPQGTHMQLAHGQPHSQAQAQALYPMDQRYALPPGVTIIAQPRLAPVPGQPQQFAYAMPPTMYAAPPLAAAGMPTAAHMQAIPPGTQIVMGHPGMPTMPIAAAPYQPAPATMAVTQSTVPSTPQLNANGKPVSAAEQPNLRPQGSPPPQTLHAAQMHHLHAIPPGAQLVMSHPGVPGVPVLAAPGTPTIAAAQPTVAVSAVPAPRPASTPIQSTSQVTTSTATNAGKDVPKAEKTSTPQVSTPRPTYNGAPTGPGASASPIADGPMQITRVLAPPYVHATPPGHPLTYASPISVDVRRPQSVSAPPPAASDRNASVPRAPVQVSAPGPLSAYTPTSPMTPATRGLGSSTLPLARSAQPYVPTHSHPNGPDPNCAKCNALKRFGGVLQELDSYPPRAPPPPSISASVGASARPTLPLPSTIAPSTLPPPPPLRKSASPPAQEPLTGLVSVQRIAKAYDAARPHHARKSSGQSEPSPPLPPRTERKRMRVYEQTDDDAKRAKVGNEVYDAVGALQILGRPAPSAASAPASAP